MKVIKRVHSIERTENNKKDYVSLLSKYDDKTSLSQRDIFTLRNLLEEISSKNIDIDTTKYRDKLMNCNAGTASPMTPATNVPTISPVDEVVKATVEKFFVNKDDYMQEDFVQNHCMEIIEFITNYIGSRSISKTECLQRINEYHEDAMRGWTENDLKAQFNAPDSDFTEEVMACAKEMIVMIRPDINRGIGSSNLSFTDSDLLEDAIPVYMKEHGISPFSNFSSMVIQAVQLLLDEADLHDSDDEEVKFPAEIYATQLKKEAEALSNGSELAALIKDAASQYECTDEEKRYVSQLFAIYKADQIANETNAVVEATVNGLPTNNIPKKDDAAIASEFREMWANEIREMQYAAQMGTGYVPGYVNPVNGFRSMPWFPYGNKPEDLTKFMERYFYKESFVATQMTKYSIGKLSGTPELDFFRLNGANKSEELNFEEEEYDFLGEDGWVYGEEKTYTMGVDRYGNDTVFVSVNKVHIPIYRKPIPGFQVDPNMPMLGYYEYEQQMRKKIREHKLSQMFIWRPMYNRMMFRGRPLTEFTDEQILDIEESYENQMYSLWLYREQERIKREERDAALGVEITWEEYYEIQEQERKRFMTPVKEYNTGDWQQDIALTLAQFRPIPKSENYLAKAENRMFALTGAIDFLEDERGWEFNEIPDDQLDDAVDQVLKVSPASGRTCVEIREKLASMFNGETFGKTDENLFGIMADRFNHTIDEVNQKYDFDSICATLSAWIIKGSFVMDDALQVYTRNRKGIMSAFRSTKEMFEERGLTYDPDKQDKSHDYKLAPVKGITASDQLTDLYIQYAM